ncbi:MAG TPA: enoyl-CoA hydratase/isomerase family protein [Gammaproteobacteria bacterium]|nr:enoyl-CoA hydratase/isomerase family protein [Gammaproteobacteria bacterium]
MNLNYLQVTVADGLLRVLINRPDKRNALSQAVLDEIGAVFTEHARNEKLVAATITGAGQRCFAAGGDLKEFDSLREPAEVERMALRSRANLDAIREFPVPVIALLNGDALGGGAELAVACDMRVLAHHAKITFVQGTLCISPAWGGGVDLVRLVGPSQALRLLTRADLLDAPAALEIGLADAAAAPGVPFADFIAHFLEPVLARKPQVMRAFKALTRAASTGVDAASLRKLETDSLVATWLHQDHWDAADAVLARISSGSAR